jgi:PAS domain S-box-containing protein
MSQTSQIGVFTTDVNLNITSWNDWLEQVTGYSQESVRGSNISRVIPEIERKGLISRFQRVLTEGGIELLTSPFHHFIIKVSLPEPVGKFTEMQQRVTISPLAGDESIDGILVTIEDMTEQMAQDSILLKDISLEDLSNEDWSRRKDVAVSLSRSGKTIISEVLRKIKYEHGNLGVLSSAMEVISMSEEDITEFLIDYLHDNDTELRIYSAQMLGNKNKREVIEALIGALSDPDVNVRYHVIESLGKLKAVQAVEHLAEMALRRDFFISFPAIDALRAIGDSRASMLILPLIDDNTLGQPALEALAEIGEADVVPVLVAHINRNSPLLLSLIKALSRISERYQDTLGEGHFISEVAVKHLNREGITNILSCLNIVSEDEAEIRSLITVLGWTDDQESRKALTKYLGHPESRKQVIDVFVSSGQKVVDLLISQLNADPETRESAILALGRIGSDKAVEPLITLLKDDQFAVVTCGALSKIGNKNSFNALLELLGHKNPSIRRAAIAALNSIGHPQMAQKIQSLLSDKNPFVRESALRIAGYFGFPEAKTFVHKLVCDTDTNVRIAAIENLPYFEDERFFSSLKFLYEDKDPKIRAAVVRSMGQLESKQAWKELEKALNDDNEWVRYYAVKAINNHGYLDLLGKIKDIALNDNAPFVRLASIEYLGHVGGPYAATVLSSLTGDTNREIVLTAINSLGDIHHPDGLPPLLALARSSDDEIRKVAIEAIGRRGGPGTSELLQWAALTEKDPVIKSRAIMSLRTISTPEALRSLLSLTSDTENRERAICALSTLPPDQLGIICEGLDHRHTLVRTAVVEVLQRVHTRQSSDMIASCLRHHDVNVRLAAIYAIHRLGSTRHFEKVVELKNSDPDPVIRKAVEDLVQARLTDIT